MPLISSSIANLINGVSQQQYTLRLPSQAEEQINGFSTTANGLMKRPPTNHVSDLEFFPVGKVKVHTINRDTTERYKAVLGFGALRVYDSVGERKTVNFPDGDSYLSTLNADQDLSAVTIGDYTFIVNKTRAVTQDTARSPVRSFEALVNVKVGNYGKAYKIIINDTVVASYTTPNGATAADAPMLSTEYIAGYLNGMLVAAGITSTQAGSIIRIAKGTDFTIRGEDGFNGNAMDVVKDSVQRFSTLPPKLPWDGFTVKVEGDPVNGQDDYWVRYTVTGTDAGVWKEAVAPDTPIALNRFTMPHVLIREADGTFTFKAPLWGQRKVGDMDSAPDPSFVGRPISEVFFYRNRLGFLSEDAVILSEAGEFFNFFPATVTSTLDSDLIDIVVSTSKVPTLRHVVPFAKKLLMFSDLAQFSLESGDLLTPKTVSAPLVTEYEASSACTPVAVGNNIYFPVSVGAHSAIKEYSVDANTGVQNAQNISEHVPRYIPNGVSKIAVGASSDILALLCPSTPDRLFMYKFYWNGTEKLQSSWSEWRLQSGSIILDVDYLDSKLYLVVRRGAVVSLEYIDLSLASPAALEPYNICLDRKTFLPASTSSSSYAVGETTLSLLLGEGSHYAVVATGQRLQAGTVVPVSSIGKIQGDFTNCALFVGTAYTFSYTFSTITAKIQNGQQGVKADTLAKLQLRYMQLNYADTGYFDVAVNSVGKSTYTYKYSGKRLGPAADVLGSTSIGGGVFRFATPGKNTEMVITISSASPTPCSFLSAEWEGFYEKRSRGM